MDSDILSRSNETTCFNFKLKASQTVPCWFTSVSLIKMILAHLIFVIFFTQPQSKAWKFYTWKCVYLQHKLACDKTAKINLREQICIKLYTVCKIAPRV